MLHKKYLAETKQSRDTVQEFKGLNRQRRCGEGEFYDMKNLCADSYPLLSTRPFRGTVMEMESPGGLIAKDALCYVDNRKLYMNGSEVTGLTLTEGEKQLVGMGAYILIWPDKKWYNTASGEFGGMENTVQVTNVSFTMSDLNGNSYENYAISPTAPDSPTDGALWLDTSQTPHSLKKYSEASEAWSGIATTYIKLTGASIGIGFEAYDGVTVSDVDTEAYPQAQDINGSHVIYARGDGYLILSGILDTPFTQESTVTVSRTVPETDFVTESGNRIWGCKYGLVDGRTVNEIYACKLGDFKNWNCFQGLSTDSYAAQRGSDGQWTGAITLGGNPLFFKENCIEKVYPSNSGAHQITVTNCRGVQKGSHRSLAIVDEVLYYKSATDVCAYDGSLPTGVSDKLGVEADMKNAVAGVLGHKYYISFDGGNGGMYVLDTEKGLWHKEDGTRAKFFARVDTELFCVNDSNQLIAVTGSEGTKETAVSYMAQSGILGLSYPDRQYVSRINIRLAASGTVNVWVRYDSLGAWVQKASLQGRGLIHSTVVPIVPRRCDHMEIKITGTGQLWLYSLTKTVEMGSDVQCC